MPTYLVHGFKWHRSNIRIHVIFESLEDAAPEWIIAPATSISLLNSFYTLFDFLPPSSPPTLPIDDAPKIPPMPPPIPGQVVSGNNGTSNDTRDRPPKTLSKKNTKSMISLKRGRRKHSANIARDAEPQMPGYVASAVPAAEENLQRPPTNGTMSSSTDNSKQAVKAKILSSFNQWSAVKLVEQYDPEDMYTVSQPFAYVGDYMVEIGLGASVSDEMAKYEARARANGCQINGNGHVNCNNSAPGTSGGLGGCGASSTITGEIGGPGLSARDLRRKSRRLGWFEKLRDELQEGEDIGWFVVVCGDLERACPSLDNEGASGVESSRSSLLESSKHHGAFRGFFSWKK